MLRYLFRCWNLLMGAMLLAVCLSGPAWAYPSLTDRWHWDVTPYYWMSDISGDVNVQGQTLPVDVSFDDIEDSIDTGVALDLMVTKPSNRIGYLLDVLYLKMDGENTFDVGTISSELQQTIAELGIMYTPKSMAEIMQASAAGKKSIPYWLYAGVRYQSLDVDLTNETTAESGGSDNNWFEPMIGAMTYLPIKGNLSAMARGDVGGFSVGESEFTWNGIIDLRYQFASSHWVNLGFRWFGLDTIEDSDNGADVTYSGPVFGFTSRF